MAAAHLRCTCPRCHGKTYNEDNLGDFLVDHEVPNVRSYEVSLVTPGQAQYMTLIGDLENGEQALVQMWPSEHTAQLAFRSDRAKTWGVPIALRPGQ